MAEAEEFAERRRQEFRSRLINGGRIDDSIAGITSWPEDQDPIRAGETVEDAVRRILDARCVGYWTLAHAPNTGRTSPLR